MLGVFGGGVGRAGYSNQANLTTDPHLNLFNTLDVTSLAVRAAVANPTTVSSNGQCILFAYDRDDDGLVDNNELLGFRLNGTTVQMRVAGDTTANSRHDSCDNANDTWQDLTDPRFINITALSFDSSQSACINLREPDGIDNDSSGAADNAEEANCYHADNIPAAGSGDLTVEAREITITLGGRLAGDRGISAIANHSVVVRNDLVRLR